MTNGEQRAPGVERTSLSGQEFTIQKIDIRDRIRKKLWLERLRGLKDRVKDTQLRY